MSRFSDYYYIRKFLVNTTDDIYTDYGSESTMK